MHTYNGSNIYLCAIYLKESIHHVVLKALSLDHLLSMRCGRLCLSAQHSSCDTQPTVFLTELANTKLYYILHDDLYGDVAVPPGTRL